MKSYQQVIANAIDHAKKGGKFILKPRCQGKPMKEINVQDLIDANFRILLLLGYATSMVMSYSKLETYHDDSEKCKWFFDAVQAVIYENKPLPPIP